MVHRWVEHEGRRILFLDLGSLGQDVDALAEEMRAAAAIIAQEPEDSVLGLADLRGTVLSQDLVGQIKGVVPKVARRMVKAAVVVDKVTGFKKVIIDAVSRLSGRNATMFENVEEAQDWLASDD